MSQLYRSLFTDVFRRAAGDSAEGAASRRGAASGYDEDTLGLSSDTASRRLGQYRQLSGDAPTAAEILRRFYDAEAPPFPQAPARVAPPSPMVAANARRSSTPPAAVTSAAKQKRTPPPREPYRVPSPLGASRPAIGEQRRSRVRGPVAAAPREPAPAIIDSFGRVPYVVPDSSSEHARKAPLSSAGESAAPRHERASSPTPRHERERVKMRNRTVLNRQPVKPRVVNTKIHGDFGLPSELPPPRPRVDAAAHELREGLRQVADTMRALNERLAHLTETHWSLQQESDRLRREIVEAETERDEVRGKFEHMCSAVKQSIAELEHDIRTKQSELVAAREENERLRRGAVAVSEAAKDRRSFVDRSMAVASAPVAAYAPIGSMIQQR